MKYRSLIAICILTVLAACGPASFEKSAVDSSLLQANTSAHAQEAPSPTKAALFISPYTGDRRVYVYGADYSKIGDIALPGKGSNVLATDVSGNLYVAPQDSREVRIYRPPSYTQYTTIGPLPPSDLVFGIAVDEVTGVLAVLECQCAYGSASQIYFYRSGQTSPCNILTTPTVATTAVFDREGVLYFGVQGGSGQNDSVSSTSGECSATKSVSLSFRKPIYPYGKLGVTKNDNIVVQSYGSPDYEQNAFSVWPLYTYARPINGVFGDPIATTPLENYGGGPDGEEVFDGMTTDGSHLWGSLGAGEAGGVRLFKYPQGGASQHMINVPNGSVAVFPPLVPMSSTVAASTDR